MPIKNGIVGHFLYDDQLPCSTLVHNTQRIDNQMKYDHFRPDDLIIFTYGKAGILLWCCKSCVSLAELTHHPFQLGWCKTDWVFLHCQHIVHYCLRVISCLKPIIVDSYYVLSLKKTSVENKDVPSFVLQVLIRILKFWLKFHVIHVFASSIGVVSILWRHVSGRLRLRLSGFLTLSPNSCYFSVMNTPPSLTYYNNTLLHA